MEWADLILLLVQRTMKMFQHFVSEYGKKKGSLFISISEVFGGNVWNIALFGKLTDHSVWINSPSIKQRKKQERKEKKKRKLEESKQQWKTS